MKNNLAKLIDVKSICTITLLLTLEVITVIVFMKNNIDLIQIVFALFSNIVTMVFTYFFARNKNIKESE